MSNLNLTYSTNTSSTGIRGRSISSARNHHIVIDDSGGEELGAGELFLEAWRKGSRFPLGSREFVFVGICRHL